MSNKQELGEIHAFLVAAQQRMDIIPAIVQINDDDFAELQTFLDRARYRTEVLLSKDD